MLRPGWQKIFADIKLPPNVKVNAAVNTNTGQTIIYDDNKVSEIDECYMVAIKYSSLQDIFLRIPSAITSSFRHIDSNLYFFTKRQFYIFNEFTNIVRSFQHVSGIECLRDGLLRQVYELHDRHYRISDVFMSDISGKEEEDDESEI